MDVRRGQIWFASLPEGVGSEQIGSRPVLIVSNDKGNEESNIVTVLVGTKKNKKDDLQTQFTVPAHFGLKFDTVFMAEQILRIDKQRLQYYITIVNGFKMQECDKAMGIALGMFEFFNIEHVKALIDEINMLDKQINMLSYCNRAELREQKMLELKIYCSKYGYSHKTFLEKYRVMKGVELVV